MTEEGIYLASPDLILKIENNHKILLSYSKKYFWLNILMSGHHLLAEKICNKSKSHSFS